MNMPDVIAFCTSLLAMSFSCCGSPAVEMTRSTGKSLPPGRDGGVVGIARTPGICDSGPIDSISNCCAVLLRSLHGLVTMPPNPPVGVISWNVAAVSGMAL